MRSRMTLVAGSALLAGMAFAGPALAAGPTPGVRYGGDGASWQGHSQRFTATLAGHHRTRVTELRRNGWPQRSRVIGGTFGVPMVAFDGSLERIPAGAGVVVLETAPATVYPHRSRLVVVSTATLRVVRRITLPGSFAFDALSPDGRFVYLIQHTSSTDIARYQVRAYDLGRARLVARVIADKRERSMDGFPVTRIYGRGAWAYTLYQGGGSHGDGTFVHALDTATLTARCIDLPGLHVQNTSDLRLALGGGGSRLVVADGGAHRIAIDTRTLRIVSPATAHARAQARTPAKAQAPSESASGTSPAAWLAASIAVAAVAAAAGLRRWRRPHPRSL